MKIGVFIFTVLLFAFACTRKELPKPPTTPSIDIIQLNDIQWHEKVQCSIVYDNGLIEQKLPAQVKFRGGASSKYYKHSFTLEIGKKIALAGLPADDDWILNASYIDKTFMRHKISYDLFNEMAATNIAPKCSYVNVSINKGYQGLYVLMEEVNAGFLQLNKTDTNAILYKDPPIFYAKFKDVNQDTSNFFAQKFPKFSDRNKSAEIIKFRDLIHKSTDSAFVTDIFKWIDIDNVIDWHIILLFSHNGDGIVKNFYLYKKSINDPFKFVPWDYDHTYGRDGDYSLNDWTIPLPWDKCLLLERLWNLEDTQYRLKLQTRWHELRSNGILTRQNFKKHIEENDALMHHEIDRNFEKWPENGLWYLDSNSYQMEVELMIDFLDTRLNYLDSTLKAF